MADTTFIPGTVIASPWLNDVNDTVYGILGNGVSIPATRQAAKANLLIPAATQCQLNTSGANLILQRFGGMYLTINGLQEAIPSGGVQLAPAGAAANTTYYIYAFMSGAVMALEFSTTVPIEDSTTGVQIKTADATRTLVGMARTTAAVAWANSNTQRFVLTYYNRRNLNLGPRVLPAPAGIFSNGVYAALAGTKLEFLVWPEETSHFDFTGSMITNVVNTTKTALGLDGAVSDAYHELTLTALSPTVFPVNLSFNGLASVGYHFIDVYSQQNAVATTTYAGGGTMGLRCAISGFVRG